MDPMTTRLRQFLKALRTPAVLMPCAFLLQGCGSVINLEGVYFPSWVICLIFGVFAGAGTLYVLQRGSLRDCLPNHGLCFVCFTTIYGILIWLLFFRS